MPPGCSGDISPGRRSWPSLCLEAGNPIIGPGGRYWALASQNACARQSISSKNLLLQCVVCSDNQVQRMDETFESLQLEDRDLATCITFGGNFLI
jgi:hypothetical protein